MDWLGHIMGLDNASGAWYLFWSGFASDLSIFGAVVAWYMHNRCAKCWRLGRHSHKPPLCRQHLIQ